MYTTMTRRLVRAAAALAAGAVMAVGVAATADAAAPPEPAKAVVTAASTDPATIDARRLGAIVIHKFRQPDGLGAAADGLEHDAGALVPIAGVEIAVEQIEPATFDLTTNAGWQALSALTPEKAAQANKGHGVRVTTDAHGVATASDLPLGVYLVSEVKWPQNVTPASPFLVTVPITDPQSLASWLYTVNVYPKNNITVPPVTNPPTPTQSPTPSTSVAQPGNSGWTPGPWVRTGGEAAMKWMGRYWAEACALVAVAASGTAALTVYRRRKQSRRAH